MFYTEGYGSILAWMDDDGELVVREVENVRLLDQFDVDTTVRPVVDSTPGELKRKSWNFDSYFHNKSGLDKALSLVVE